MYCPLVGERVWVIDCPDAFVVTYIDYTAALASICLIGGDELVRRVPFTLITQQPQFGGDPAKKPSNWDVVRSSHECVKAARALMREAKDTIEKTRVAVETTKILIEKSDQLVRRARTLDCDRLLRRTDDHATPDEAVA